MQMMPLVLESLACGWVLAVAGLVAAAPAFIELTFPKKESGGTTETFRMPLAAAMASWAALWMYRQLLATLLGGMAEDMLHVYDVGLLICMPVILAGLAFGAAWGAPRPCVRLCVGLVFSVGTNLLSRRLIVLASQSSGIRELLIYVNVCLLIGLLGSAAPAGEKTAAASSAAPAEAPVEDDNALEADFKLTKQFTGSTAAGSSEPNSPASSVARSR